MAAVVSIVVGMTLELKRIEETNIIWVSYVALCKSWIHFNSDLL